MRVAGRRRVAAGRVGRGGGRALGPGSLPFPSPPPASRHLCVSEPGRGSQTRNKSGFPPRGCHLLGFHTSGGWGEGAAALFPVSSAAPRPGTGGLSAAQRGGARGRGGGLSSWKGPERAGPGGSQGECDGLLCGREVSP